MGTVCWPKSPVLCTHTYTLDRYWKNRLPPFDLPNLLNAGIAYFLATPFICCRARNVSLSFLNFWLITGEEYYWPKYRKLPTYVTNIICTRTDSKQKERENQNQLGRMHVKICWPLEAARTHANPLSPPTPPRPHNPRYSQCTKLHMELALH